MANHKSAAKRARQTTKRTARNRQYISSVRTAVKKFRLALTEGKDSETLQNLFKSAQTLLSKAAAKGMMHKNTASRSVQRLARKLTGEGAAAAAQATTTKKKVTKKKVATKKTTKKKTSKKTTKKK